MDKSVDQDPVGSARPARGAGMAVTRTFSLSRWFAIVGLVSITLICIVAAVMLSRFLTERMLHQEGVLTMEFVESIVHGEGPTDYFERNTPADMEKFEHVFGRIARMQDVLRANVHSPDRVIVWSSDPALVGKRFTDNDELEEALAGELVVHDEDTADPDIVLKGEHKNLFENVNYFVELYVPVWDEGRTRVIAVAELYKRPRALFEAIRAGRLWIWSSAALGGLAFYLALFSLIRRADNLIRSQQDRLIETETLAAVGEMGTAVAHGIRNPLTAIRSSAELCLEGEPDLSKEAARDIMAEVDRLEQWVRDLLSYSRPVSGKADRIAVKPLLSQCYSNYAREMERRGIAGAVDLPDGLPAVRGDPMLLGQVVNSLIANAIEALKEGGSIRVAAATNGQKQVELSVRDSGPGMTRDEVARVFKPFYTTKPKGLGVGLPLAKRIVERLGGRIRIDSMPGQGTDVVLTFPADS